MPKEKALMALVPAVAMGYTEAAGIHRSVFVCVCGGVVSYHLLCAHVISFLQVDFSTFPVSVPILKRILSLGT